MLRGFIKKVAVLLLTVALIAPNLNVVKAYADTSYDFSMTWDDINSITITNIVRNVEYPSVLYFNGESINKGTCLYDEDCTQVSLRINEYINESGTYTYKRDIPLSDGANDAWWRNTTWTANAVSVSCDYTKPATHLYSPINLEMNNYVLSWDEDSLQDEGKVLYYKVERQTLRADGTEAYSQYDWAYEKSFSFADQVYSYNFYDAGDRYRVRAISNDLVNLANSDWSEWTPVYSRDTQAVAVSNALSSILGDNTKSAAEKLDSLISNVADGSSDLAANSLRVGMASDANIENQIADLEAEYLAANTAVSVTPPAVSEDVKSETGIDASQVSITGAGLNAGGSGEMGLSITKPTSDEAFAGVEGWTQIDIKLTKDGQAQTGNLAVPVAITMPLPTSVSTSNLVIWHVHGDGTRETVNYRINSDGTLTFAVSSFSVFIFGNEDPSETEDPTTAYVESIVNQIEVAASAGQKVVELHDCDTLGNAIMKALLNNPSVSLTLYYTYDGVDYKVIIPAGAAVNDDIPWYGPLWLAGKYGNSLGKETTGNSYVIKGGDTLNNIAAKLGLTLEAILKMNPSITNANKIFAGQTINY